MMTTVTPTQDLTMEVLTARHRLGESFWTFKSMHEKVLRELEREGLVWVMHGVVEGTLRAGLTDEGKKLYLSASYTPPILEGARDYDARNPTSFSKEECEEAVGKRATLTLTGKVISCEVGHAGPFVKLKVDDRWGFDDYRLGIDLDALILQEEV